MAGARAPPRRPAVQAGTQAVLPLTVPPQALLDPVGAGSLRGVRAVDFSGALPLGSQSGLEVEEGVGYRAGSWALVAVHLPQPVLSPGESCFVVVETDNLPAKAGEVFRLELLDKNGGRRLPITSLKGVRPPRIARP